MKSSLKKKLRGFSLGKNGGKDDQVQQQQHQKRSLPQLDELAQASQDIQDMHECYDGLMSASALTANSVYEFSEALQEMGSCLLEKTALNNDEDSGRVLIMLGKVQYDLHKILDRYRTHISQTITAPSESLLNELQNVEDLKEQCDRKRKAYDCMREERAKGKSKTSKGETTVSSEQLQSAKEDYETDMTFLTCRLKSLKQGQPRSLLTQAARHYSAQLHLFRKGLAFLEALEAHVKKIADQQHIDYPLNELEEDDGEVSYELSQTDLEYDDSTSSENSMQLDREASSSPRSSLHSETAQLKANFEEAEYRFGTARRSTVGSKSAPLTPSTYGKSDRIDKILDTQPNTATQRNLHTYALPIPVSAKSGNTTGGGSNFALGSGTVGETGAVNSLWHTAPLGQPKSQTGSEIASIKNDLNLHESADNFRTNHLLSRNGIPKARPLPEEPNTNNRANALPVPSSVERVPMVRFDIPVASDSKRIKRHAFSGPLTGKLWSSRPSVSGSGGLASKPIEPSFKSGPVARSSISHPFGSSKISPSVSPPNLSPTHVSVLYELPKPPSDSTKPVKSSNMISHSAPLVAKKNQEHLSVQKAGITISKPASPLPPPPPGLATTRSFSIPSSAQKGQVLQLPKNTDIPERILMTEEVPSPPLTPIPFPSHKGKSSSAKPTDRAGESSEMVTSQALPLRGCSPTPELGRI
uniref:BAR domain-containing protein n=1 Tax=Araucaria cunninghamii TaxID=56994 RepID=A0A0D6QX07_ARACU